MAENMEMVLVSRDELQQLIGLGSCVCGHCQNKHLAAREAGAYQGAADWAACPVPERTD